MEANHVQKHAAEVILDRGMRYTAGGESITLRPLRYGALLLICAEIAGSGLTLEKIEAGEKDVFDFFAKYGDLVLRCIAIAEVNDFSVLEPDVVASRVQFYKENLHALQIYELFAQVINLSGIQPFTTTIRLLFTMKEANLSPRNEKGS